MSKLDEVIADMNKKVKEDVVTSGLPKYDYKKIPFTSPRMNYCTFGGLPVGKLIEFFGEEHGGKTTTALDIIANYQNMDDARKVLYVDAENTLDVDWAVKLGVDVDSMIVFKPTSQSAEEIFQFILDAIGTGEIGLWVLDSIGVLASAQELDKSMEEKTYAGVSAALTVFGRKAEMLMQRHHCTGIGINQLRDDMNAMWGGAVKTPGGRAWKHYCFSGNTKFVTDKGILRFRDCKDGEKVTVVDMYGNLQEATVHHYGKQELQKVTLCTPNMKHEVICTPDHRWVLADGTVTQNLRVGDTLYMREENISFPVKTQRQAEMFCMGFAIGDGTDYHGKRDAVGVKCVLYGDKEKYAGIFELAKYNKSRESKKFTSYSKLHISKQNFLTGKCWKYLTAEDKRFLFMGYYAADGRNDGTPCKSCVTYDSRVLEFITNTSALAGYFITSIKNGISGESSFKPGQQYCTIHFTTHSSKYNHWKVKEIKAVGVGNTYCVEEPVTHTFTLEKGIVTGNCCVRMQFSRGKFIDARGNELTRSAESPAGNLVMMSLVKTKSCPPTRRTGFYTLNYEYGIDYLKDLVEVALKYGLIEKSGAWFSIIDPETGELLERCQGQAKVYDYLSDNSHEDALAKLEDAIDKKIQMN